MQIVTSPSKKICIIFFSLVFGQCGSIQVVVVVKATQHHSQDFAGEDESGAKNGDKMEDA